MNARLILTKFFGLLILLAVLLGAYWFAIRPGQLHWGSTPEEASSPMPGDEIVHQPTFKATRAITISGTPEEIWPWLIQMGYGRAGYYGYDLFENIGSPSGIHSADHIVAEYQQLAVGDPLPIFPGATMQVGKMDPYHTFIWVGRSKDSGAAFTWALIPLDAQHTRLISRVQFRHEWNNLFQAGQIGFTEFLDHLAIRKILLGIKGRVERQVEPWSVQIGETATFVTGALEFAAALLLFLLRKPRLLTWGFAFLTGTVLLFVLYAHAPYGFCAIIEIMVLMGFIRLFPGASTGEVQKEFRWKTN